MTDTKHETGPLVAARETVNRDHTGGRIKRAVAKLKNKIARK